MGCEVLGVGMGRVELGVGSWAWVEGGLRVGSWESVVGSGEWVVGTALTVYRIIQFFIRAKGPLQHGQFCTFGVSKVEGGFREFGN